MFTDFRRNSYTFFDKTLTHDVCKSGCPINLLLQFSGMFLDARLWSITYEITQKHSGSGIDENYTVKVANKTGSKVIFVSSRSRFTGQEKNHF